jgi:hypothetical protein
MIKTEIIGFCQKINRIVKLVEMSDTLTKKTASEAWTLWQEGVGKGLRQECNFPETGWVNLIKLT